MQLNSDLINKYFNFFMKRIPLSYLYQRVVWIIVNLGSLSEGLRGFYAMSQLFLANLDSDSGSCLWNLLELLLYFRSQSSYCHWVHFGSFTLRISKRKRFQSLVFLWLLIFIFPNIPVIWYCYICNHCWFLVLACFYDIKLIGQQLALVHI